MTNKPSVQTNTNYDIDAEQRDKTRGTYVFTWGEGFHGQLGRKFVRGQKKSTPYPKLVELNVVVKQVVCGSLHAALVTGLFVHVVVVVVVHVVVVVVVVVVCCLFCVLCYQSFRFVVCLC